MSGEHVRRDYPSPLFFPSYMRASTGSASTKETVTPQHIKRGDENSAAVFAVPTQSPKHIQGGQRKVAQFPLLLLPPLDCSVCEANDTAGGEIFPSIAFNVCVPSHSSAFTSPTPPRRLRRMPLAPLWFNLLLVRYHPTHYFSPNDLFPCI